MTRFDTRIGAEYDEFEKASPMYRTMQKETAKIVKEHEGRKILEIGCGTGITTKAVYETIGKAELYHAIDNSKTMIEQAKKNMRMFHEQESYELIHKDAKQALEKYSDETFDTIITGFTTHNLKSEERAALFKESYRVLKRGGLLINMDKFAHPDARVHREQYEWQTKQFDVFDETLKEEWIEHYAEDDQEGIVMREDDYIRNLRSIGFEKLHVRMRYEMDAIITATKAPVANQE